LSGSHVGHVRPDFTEALIKHGKLEAVDGYLRAGVADQSGTLDDY